MQRFVFSRENQRQEREEKAFGICPDVNFFDLYVTWFEQPLFLNSHYTYSR